MALYLGQNKVKFNLSSGSWILHINDLEDNDVFLYSSDNKILMSRLNEYLIPKQITNRLLSLDDFFLLDADDNYLTT